MTHSVWLWFETQRLWVRIQVGWDVCHHGCAYTLPQTVQRPGVSVFHLALSNMAQRQVAFCERHVVLRERHVALLECHVALHVHHVALLIFRQWSASFKVFLCHIQHTQAILTVKNTPVTNVSRSHLSGYTLNQGGWVLETPNWVPGVHDKVPLMLGGAMPLLTPRWNTEYGVLSMGLFTIKNPWKSFNKSRA